MLVSAFANIFWWFMNYFLMFLESSPVTDGITVPKVGSLLNRAPGKARNRKQDGNGNGK